jgi:hypothetical protein
VKRGKYDETGKFYTLIKQEYLCYHRHRKEHFEKEWERLTIENEQLKGQIEVYKQKIKEFAISEIPSVAGASVLAAVGAFGVNLPETFTLTTVFYYGTILTAFSWVIFSSVSNIMRYFR